MPPGRVPGPPGCGVTSPARRRRTADAGFTRYRPNQVAPSSKRLAKTPSAEPGDVDYNPNRNIVKRGSAELLLDHSLPIIDPKKSGAPEGIRTPDPQIRSLVLYPAELPALDAFRSLAENSGAPA